MQTYELDTLSEDSYKEGILIKKREENNGNSVLFSIITKDNWVAGLFPDYAAVARQTRA
jgi:hypothetical protein